MFVLLYKTVRSFQTYCKHSASHSFPYVFLSDPQTGSYSRLQMQSGSDVLLFNKKPPRNEIFVNSFYWDPSTAPQCIHLKKRIYGSVPFLLLISPFCTLTIIYRTLRTNVVGRFGHQNMLLKFSSILDYISAQSILCAIVHIY